MSERVTRENLKDAVRILENTRHVSEKVSSAINILSAYSDQPPENPNDVVWADVANIIREGLSSDDAVPQGLLTVDGKKWVMVKQNHLPFAGAAFTVIDRVWRSLSETRDKLRERVEPPSQEFQVGELVTINQNGSQASIAKATLTKADGWRYALKRDSFGIGNSVWRAGELTLTPTIEDEQAKVDAAEELIVERDEEIRKLKEQVAAFHATGWRRPCKEAADMLYTVEPIGEACRVVWHRCGSTSKFSSDEIKGEFSTRLAACAALAAYAKDHGWEKVGG